MKIYPALYFLLFGLLLVSSCSGPEISCEKDNQEKLLAAAEKFIRENLSSDEKTKNIMLENFRYKGDSCYKSKGIQSVNYVVEAEYEKNGRTQKTKFICTTKRDRGNIDTTCHMSY